MRAQERSSALIGEGKTKEDFGKIVNTFAESLLNIEILAGMFHFRQ